MNASSYRKKKEKQSSTLMKILYPAVLLLESSDRMRLSPFPPLIATVICGFLMLPYVHNWPHESFISTFFCVIIFAFICTVLFFLFSYALVFLAFFIDIFTAPFVALYNHLKQKEKKTAAKTTATSVGKKHQEIKKLEMKENAKTEQNIRQNTNKNINQKDEETENKMENYYNENENSNRSEYSRESENNKREKDEIDEACERNWKITSKPQYLYRVYRFKD